MNRMLNGVEPPVEPVSAQAPAKNASASNAGCMCAPESIGASLKAARQRSGISLAAIAQATRVPIRYLRAFENDAVESFPEPVFRRGHLRAHALAVGLDPDLLTPAPDALERDEWQTNEPAGCRALVSAAVGALVAAATVFPADPSAAVADAVFPAALLVDDPQMALRMQSSARPAMFPDLRLLALRDARVRVQGRDGTIFVSRVMRTGETHLPRLGAGWTVTAGDGSAFAWQIDGQTRRAVAPPGVPVLALEIDEVLAEFAIVAVPAGGPGGT